MLSNDTYGLYRLPIFLNIDISQSQEFGNPDDRFRQKLRLVDLYTIQYSFCFWNMTQKYNSTHLWCQILHFEIYDIPPPV